jgi:hypothetical protein
VKDQPVTSDFQKSTAPPGSEKPAGVGSAHGLTQNSKYEAGTVALFEAKGKPRSYETQEAIDEALKELNRAYADGQIGEAEYLELDHALRSKQAKTCPKKPARIGALIAGARSKLTLGWPRRRPCRSPDREKSRERARMLGGSSAMPPKVRAKYTECERAVLTIVAREIKRQGICDLTVGQIAAEAGVCIRTVQNATAEAVRQGHLAREERPQLGRKNLTNILRIHSAEWLAWIKRGPIGCKEYTATKNIDSKQEDAQQFPRVARFIRVSG